MSKEYCVYSNKYVDCSELNKEHIIPKGLGGHLDLSIKVDKQINSKLGSEVDAPFTENAFIKLKGKDFNFTGHSKKITPTFKNSTIVDTNEKVDVSIINNALHFRKKHSRDSKGWNKSLEECKVKGFNVNFEINMDVYTRFFAKILLGSSYYLYGEDFIKFGFHEDLRKLMNIEKPMDLIDTKKINVRVLSAFENPEPFMNIVTSDINAFKNFHVVWGSIYKNAVVVGVSLWGDKFLSANCVISNTPEKFNAEIPQIVLLKELSSDSKRRLIFTTQEDVITKFSKEFLPDFDIDTLKQQVLNSQKNVEILDKPL